MILANLLLALAWAALTGRFTLESLVMGLAAGHVVLLVLAKGGVLAMAEVSRVERALSLLAYLLWEIFLANVRVALDVVSIQHRMKPGVIRLPLDVTSDGEILLLAAMINITPGSVALGVSDDRKIMYVHVMHVRTPDDARRIIKEGFERRVIGLRSERKESPHAV
ncbi:MAG: Na+/H+ antiporter subunit E [Bryobacteraceae bacterium]|nr:Na+/H+ antiporter subunit E [Bryobacterales bacterium]MEB2360721.1 Na+/H+ antiporter subunit E [Bryobacterales bacterium]NUN01881.1 Na+/H+ antiporter subunit E [Bryobacteraceae bacterium]